MSTKIRPFWKKCPLEVIVYEMSPFQNSLRSG
jgi:hypothetical protein